MKPAASVSLPHAESVLALLGPLAPRFELSVIPECSSTNTVLRDETCSGPGRVRVLIAHRQTGGRGRRGREWLSWPGASLTFSSRWAFEPADGVPAGLSLVAGIALARVLEEIGVTGVQLKWPNDILVSGRKIAGILVELSPERGQMAAVVGIGLNLALPDAVALPAGLPVTDLSRHVHPSPDPNLVVARILAELHALFETYAQAGFSALKGAWAQRNAFAGQPVRILADEHETLGVCEGVDDDGALLLRTERGLERILSGDVSLRPHTG